LVEEHLQRNKNIEESAGIDNFKYFLMEIFICSKIPDRVSFNVY